MQGTLKVISIFKSIDGEINGFNGAGQVTTFVRLAGCNLRCSYCDTRYAWDPAFNGFKEPMEMTIEEIVEQIETPHVTITGGEPLLQSMVTPLLLRLSNDERRVTVETNGTFHPSIMNYLIRYVVDYKIERLSGNYAATFRTVLMGLRAIDVVKIVVRDEDEFHLAKDNLDGYTKRFAKSAPRRAYSPLYGVMDPAELAELVIEHDPEASISLQLHKIIWPNADQER